MGFLYFGEKEGHLLVVGGERGYLVEHVDEVTVVFGLEDHFLVDCEPRLCESRMLDAQLVLARSLCLGVAHGLF